jgi:hypothetical protein
MPSIENDDFDWSNPEDVCIREQAAVACYRNKSGEIIIRQCGGSYDEDCYVLIAPANVPTLLHAIADTAGINITIGTPGRPVTLLPAPVRAPTSHAERQKRYRQRHGSNGLSVTDGVTRDGIGRDGA